MGTGAISEGYLAQVTFWAFLVTVLLTWKALGPGRALIAFAIKYAVVYWLFLKGVASEWILPDSSTYHALGAVIREEYGVIQVLLSRESRKFLYDISGGVHVLYPWLNAVAQSLVGDTNYAVIVMNNFVHSLSALALFGIVRRCGFGTEYARWLSVFFVLSISLGAWIAYTNLKDVIVLALSLCLLHGALLLKEKITIIRLIYVVISVILFLWLRFYTPFLVLLALFAWLFLYSSKKDRLRMVVVLLAATAVFLYQTEPRWFFNNLAQIDIIRLPYGALQMFLTPRPWSIEHYYAFLLVPSLVHWLLAIPIVLGVLELWSRGGMVRFVLLYVLLGMVFYSVLPAFLGPRQRVQFEFALIWAAYHWVYVVGLRLIGEADRAERALSRA